MLLLLNTLLLKLFEFSLNLLSSTIVLQSATVQIINVKITVCMVLVLQNDAATAALLGVIWSKNLPWFIAVHPETIAVIRPNV